MPRGFSGRVFHKSALRSWDLLSPSSIWFDPVLLWGKPAKSCLHFLSVKVRSSCHLHQLSGTHTLCSFSCSTSLFALYVCVDNAEASCCSLVQL